MTLNEAKEILESNGYIISEMISTPVIMGVKSHAHGRSSDLSSNVAMDAIDNFRKQAHEYIGYRALDRINYNKDNVTWYNKEKSIINALKPYEESFENFIKIASQDPKYFAGILGIDGCFTHYRVEDIVSILKKIKNHPEIFTKKPGIMDKAKFKFFGKTVKENTMKLSEAISCLEENGYTLIKESDYSDELC